MGSSVQPLQLYVNLQLVLRVYRATPHSSTGRTPFELISSGPLPPRFPHLQLSSRINQDTQDSPVTKNGSQRAHKFETGDRVLVYNTQTKTNTTGIVKEPKSMNSYIVIIDKCEKHISGDHMRLLSKRCEMNKVRDNKHTKVSMDLSDSEFINNKNCENLDNKSVISDDSDIYIPSIFNNRSIIPNTEKNSVNKKKYRVEHEKLHDGLSTNLRMSRTRSGRN